MSALAPNYKRKNLSFVKGKGSFLVASDGKKYLDFVQGIAVNSLGHSNKKLINVFVPTTPNPTSGFLLMFPIEDVIYLNMSFEEASKFIVSAGTSTKKS